MRMSRLKMKVIIQKTEIGNVSFKAIASVRKLVPLSYSFQESVKDSRPLSPPVELHSNCGGSFTEVGRRKKSPIIVSHHH